MKRERDGDGENVAVDVALLWLGDWRFPVEMKMRLVIALRAWHERTDFLWTRGRRKIGSARF